MAFPKGKKRPENAGRRKGTPNKKTQNLMEILNSNGFDPAQKLIDLYNRSLDENVQCAVLRELIKYVYPQRKAIEVSGQIDHKLLTRIEELKAMSPEQLEEARIKALKLVSGKRGS